MTAVSDHTLGRYLDAARSADHRAATTIVLDLLHDGVPRDQIIDELLAAAQRQTGERWWRNEWTVVDEHLVTTTTAAVVEALSSASDRSPASGHLVVVCAEGDWHGLPGRLFSERMRDRGWHVTFLGASTPADHVAEFLGRSAVDALAVTCAVPLTFRGAARLADVAHEVDLPVLIGGAAISPNPQRALELGADADPSTPDEADTALLALRGTPVSRPPVRLRWTAFQLEADADDLAGATFTDLERAFPTMKGYDERQRQRTMEDLVYTVRFLAAAVLVNDPSVWWDYTEWQHGLLEARGVPARAFDDAIAILGGHLGDRYPKAADLLIHGTPQPSS